MKIKKNTILFSKNFRNKKCQGMIIFSWSILINEKVPGWENPATPFSFYLDFIQVLFRLYPDFIQILSKFDPDKIRIEFG